MAKNFPYFKFIVTEWMTGNIVYESFSAQGLFINICALYWQRDGVLSLSEINKRYKNPSELPELENHFFVVTDGMISIKFLDEQLIEANHISKVNSKNGSLGGRPKKTDLKPNQNRPLIELKPNKSKEEVNKNKIKEEINNSVYASEIISNQQWCEQLFMKHKVIPDEIENVISEFTGHLILKGSQKESAEDFKDHLCNWLRITDLSKWQIKGQKTLGKSNQIGKTAADYDREEKQ